VLSGVLLATIVGTLVLSGLILLVMLSREEQRRRAELRSARARRLRYLKGGKHGKVGDEVVLDTLPYGSERKELLEKLHPRTPKSDLGLIPLAGPFHVFCATVGIGPPVLHSCAASPAQPVSAVCMCDVCVCGPPCTVSHNWLHGQNVMRIVKTRLRELLPDIEVRWPASSHPSACLCSQGVLVALKSSSTGVPRCGQSWWRQRPPAH
jgi:hypothetical protein